MDTAVVVGVFSWPTEKVTVWLPRSGVKSMRAKMTVEEELWWGLGLSLLMMTRFVSVRMLLRTLPECLVLFLMRCDVLNKKVFIEG